MELVPPNPLVPVAEFTLSYKIHGVPEGTYPATRYFGSKRRLLPKLYEVFEDLEFESALDLFGGTGIVSYLFKRMQKQVTFNDNLWSNYWSATALIENSSTLLTDSDVAFLIQSAKTRDESEPGFIEKTFHNLYFTQEENRWLDNFIISIEELSTKYSGATKRYKKAIALHALFQSALRKRPFNMFHRANLSLRMSNVTRTFGNLTTWNTSFPNHFQGLVAETNALVFDNGHTNRIFCEDARGWHPSSRPDLVYIDPPYVPRYGSWSSIDYLPKYHFLEGLARYDEWADIIQTDTQIRGINDGYVPWVPRKDRNIDGEPLASLSLILERFKDSTLVFSYREPGNPTIEELVKLMKQWKSKVQVYRWPYKYALSKRTQSDEQHSFEVILVGT